MDSLKRYTWLRNAFLVLMGFALVGWVYTIYVAEIPDPIDQKFQIAAFVMATVWLGLFALITNIAVGQFTAQKVFAEEGWHLVELRVHVPSQPVTHIPINRGAMSATSIDTSLLNHWGMMRNKDLSQTRILIQRVSEKAFPLTYVFEKGNTSTATEAAEGEAQPA